MGRIFIRPAVVTDQKTLEALQWRASLNNPGDRDALLENSDAIALPAAQIEAGGVYVADIEKQPMGFAAILPREDGDSELDALFVEPESWGQGIGRALVEHCCSIAKESGAECLCVVGNPHAQGFYLACEFELQGTVQTRFGPGLLMKRRLI
jgi:GNAT superfamily N-acetyltransferase